MPRGPGVSEREESALGQLKRRPDTRHVPVVVLGDRAARLSALRAGAAVFLGEPAGAIELDRALAAVARLTESKARRIAVVADDVDLVDQVTGVLGGGDEIELTWIESADAVVALGVGCTTSG